MTSSEDDELTLFQYMLWPLGHAIIILIAWLLAWIPVIGDWIYSIALFLPPVLAAIGIVRVKEGYFKRFLGIAVAGLIVLPISTGIVGAIDGSGFQFALSVGYLFNFYYIPIAMIAAFFKRPKQTPTPMAQEGVPYTQTDPMPTAQPSPVGQAATQEVASIPDQSANQKSETPVKQFCPNCGTEGTSAFCSNCGQKL